MGEEEDVRLADVTTLEVEPEHPEQISRFFSGRRRVQGFPRRPRT